MITSRQNALIKLIRSLKNKKDRDEKGLYVAEGIKIVREAIAAGQKIFCAAGTAETLASMEFGSVRTEEVSRDVFESISGEVSPQGVLCVLEKPSLTPVKPRGNCLLLDGVSDPANVGAIIRTAAAAGYNDVYACNSADPFNPKAVRASMSGIFRVGFYECAREDVKSIIGLPLITADMNGEDVFGFSSPDKFCLVIGNEANGVSEFIKRRACRSVRIPMENGTESLNAAVSAGILMYLLKRR